MLTYAQTLKEQLSESIERHGLAEVLDRLAELVHGSSYANGGQIVRLLEDSTRLALAQSEPGISELEIPVISPLRN